MASNSRWQINYVRTHATATIYEVEQQGIDLVMNFATLEVDGGTPNRQINMNADNQAEIRSMARPEGRSAYLFKHIADV